LRCGIARDTILDVLVVLDTCVIVSGLRSRHGASFRVLSRIGHGAFELAVSVPLVVEYEDVLARQAPNLTLSQRDVGDLLDYICSVARRQSIFFLWRPLLTDPKDDMVAEVAVAAQCDAIVTFNTKDFRAIDRFGIAVMTPGQFLSKLGAPQ
jgi:putative PIN family toxin of toxin-antitoxin system